MQPRLKLTTTHKAYGVYGVKAPKWPAELNAKDKAKARD